MDTNKHKLNFNPRKSAESVLSKAEGIRGFFSLKNCVNPCQSVSNKCGFSLAETVIALGVLTVGMMFIAAVFPVGIYLTNLSIERTTAAVAADEAFTKINLYAQKAFDDAKDSIIRNTVDIQGLQTNQQRDFNDWFNWYVNAPNFDNYSITMDDFAYPSVKTENNQYYWSALCRLIADDPLGRTVQVTVFINKKIGAASKYYNQDFSGLADFPVPVKIEVQPAGSGRDNELDIIDADFEQLISDGYTIVDDETGRIYRVLQRYASNPQRILLDKDWTGSSPGDIWVVPPPYQPSPTAVKRVSGRYPCIGVYQKIIRF